MPGDAFDLIVIGSGLRQRGLYGIDSSINRELTVPDFMYRKDQVVRSLWSMIEANLGRHRIELVSGYGEFEDPHTIRVTAMDGGVRRLSAPVVLIATGSYPHWPDDVTRDPERLYDSDTILEMDRIPRSLAVVGAGVIGCEYATMFRALGIEVTLVCGQDRPAP
jgi:NAD(P) transhydrogenase